jgi:germination protein M
VRRALVLLLFVALAGCGGGNGDSAPPTTEAPATETTPTETVSTDPSEVQAVLVYFLREGRIAATTRMVPATKAVARAALTALPEGPTADERDIGFETEVPVDLSIDSLAIAGGTATLDLSSGSGCPPMAQVVYTLTQFPTVDRVAGNCLPDGPADRKTFEDVAPAILVEHPAPFEEVASPLRLRGTANTFEATFQITLVDWDGRIIHEQFATATSGTGERGTFDVTIPFTVDLKGGAVIVYELSAKDGSRIHLIEIPLRLLP